MNAFPDFMKNDKNRIAAGSQHGSGIEGYVFDGADGSQMAFWTCEQDGTSAEHVHDYDEYFTVVQGAYTLIMGDERTVVTAGKECFIPKGAPHAGEYIAGTRTIHAFGGKRAERQQTEDAPADLTAIRLRIDAIDKNIITLLAKRSVLVSAAGKLKKTEDGVRDPRRVEQVIAKVRTTAVDAGLAPDIAEAVYRAVIAAFIGKEMAEFRKSSDQSVRVYAKKNLALKPDVPGAQMWAVGLDKAMLTYFEMESDTVFAEHSHEAEQITLVLEGRLIFCYHGKQVTLGPGEVIAIPSNMPHSVSTGNSPCKAVDAWSPVRREYLKS